MSEELKKHIRSIKDFPKKGIMFRDITTLLKEPKAFNKALDELLAFTDQVKIDKVVGIESRGFIFGSVIAQKLGVGFIPARKPGKLPAETESAIYQLEYGEDKIEMHKDAINPGNKVLLHDDLLATGGTAEAVTKLIERLGGEVVQISFLIELSFLNGRDKLTGYNIKSLIMYDDEN
ncbi:MAG: adenine phosphoribosyltransferase [Ignavibacteriaceae bacterium]|nr:adenine phosphoribosyltransferase [Ignavibacteriaceae bacterium]